MSYDVNEMQIDGEDVILLLLEANERLLGKDAIGGITRLQKLLFLLERETEFEGIVEFFPFEPYNFGPFSKKVDEAVAFLEGCGLIEIRQKQYSSLFANSNESKLESEISDIEVPQGIGENEIEVTEKLFSLTKDGRTVASKMRAMVRPSDITALDEIVQKYGNRPLNQLIRYVYRRYPEMTVKSIHPEAQKHRF